MGVLTSTDTVFQALTVYDQTYTNAVSRSESDAATRAIAQWATQIRDDIFELNDAANGDEAWTQAGITARFAGAPATGYSAFADELAIGSGSGNNGLTIYSGGSGSGTIAFRDPGSATDFYILCSHAAGYMQLATGGTARARVGSAGVYPESDGVGSSGIDTSRWSAGYFAGTLYAADAPTSGFYAGADDILCGDGSDSELGFSGYTTAGGYVWFLQRTASGPRPIGIFLHDFSGTVGFRINGSTAWNFTPTSFHPQSDGGGNAGQDGQGLGILYLQDGVTAPSNSTSAAIYIDSADGDLKVRFADGTVKTIATDT